MSKFTKKLRKVKLFDICLKNLMFIKIWQRNKNAIPVRIEQTYKANLVLDQIAAKNHRVFFCGIPTHNNMGDQAQRYCIQNWIRYNYPQMEVVPLTSWPFYDHKFQNRLKTIVVESDIFIIQSGYCTTDSHYDHPMHKFIVKTFQNNKILIMPQTVNYIIERHGYQTGKIYGKNKNLLFLARDRKSYELAIKYMPYTRILLYPDIVTSLIGTYKADTERKGVLICVRNDGEKKYTDTDILQLRKKFKTCGITCQITDTNSKLSLNELLDNFEHELLNEIKFFSKFEVVITDRYHGTIFSMIANTPVIVLETIDHKVKTGTEWFNGIYDGAYYNAVSLEMAFTFAVNVINQGIRVCNSPYFKEKYYDKLKEKFEEGIKDVM